MALWQIRFEVYPAGRETGAWAWPAERLVALTSAMAAILPMGRNWSKVQILLGDVESHCFEVWLAESGEPEEASLRLDLRRSDVIEIVTRSYAVLTAFELQMAESESHVRLWAKDQLVSCIERSRAMAFVGDPSKYLRDHDDEIK
jgi:hypothetical protein